eukprot:tig00000492_g1519.t1
MEFRVGEHELRVVEEGAGGRYVEVRSGGRVVGCEECSGELLFARVSDDGTFFNCAAYDPAARVGRVVSFAGTLSSDAVKVPESSPELGVVFEFTAAISPSGRSIAYTFYRGHEHGIWVMRKREDGSWRRDQLRQQCGYKFTVDDRTITFDMDSRG